MPDCPSCGTWNPDDKTVCWRCQTEMPTPKPKKKPIRLLGMPLWTWVALGLLAITWVLVTCVGPRLLPAAGG